MKKAFGYMFGIGAAIIALVGILVLVFTYWEKIVAYTSAGVRVASNIVAQFTGDSTLDDETDSYDI
ncbi:hypothetical protein AGMMS49983_05640 [Clostridia bacterium]|nr:hypothetical protein AGMMS49983_05640 [Clostridia bacterium]